MPAIEFEQKWIVVSGKWLKLAVLHDEEWLENELQNPEDCIRTLKENKFPEMNSDIFTFTQKIPDGIPRYEYPMEWDSIAVVRTNSFRDWWDSLPQESRKNVRRSQKRGVTVSSREFNEELVRGIVGINNDTPMKQGRPNDHYGKTVDQVRKDLESFINRSDFICAHVGDEMIGYLKLVFRGNVATLLNLTCKASHFDKRPSNALLAKAVELCEQKGITHLAYGKFNYGNKRDSPLREFKIRNGFEEILMPRYFVPLTVWGRICIKLKLHRGVVGILPENVIGFLVGVRSKWYNFKPLSKPV